MTSESSTNDDEQGKQMSLIDQKVITTKTSQMKRKNKNIYSIE